MPALSVLMLPRLPTSLHLPVETALLRCRACCKLPPLGARMAARSSLRLPRRASLQLSTRNSRKSYCSCRHRSLCQLSLCRLLHTSRLSRRRLCCHRRRRRSLSLPQELTRLLRLLYNQHRSARLRQRTRSRAHLWPRLTMTTAGWMTRSLRPHPGAAKPRWTRTGWSESRVHLLCFASRSTPSVASVHAANARPRAARIAMRRGAAPGAPVVAGTAHS